MSMRSSPLSSLSTVSCRVHHFLTSEPEEASSLTGFILHTMDLTLVRPEEESKNTNQGDSFIFILHYSLLVFAFIFYILNK